MKAPDHKLNDFISYIQSILLHLHPLLRRNVCRYNNEINSIRLSCALHFCSNHQLLFSFYFFRISVSRRTQSSVVHIVDYEAAAGDAEYEILDIIYKRKKKLVRSFR